LFIVNEFLAALLATLLAGGAYRRLHNSSTCLATHDTAVNRGRRTHSALTRAERPLAPPPSAAPAKRAAPARAATSAAPAKRGDAIL